MPKPTIGRIVQFAMDPAQNNGADVAPAIITRVWSDTCVNLRVLADSHAVDWKTSVPLFESRGALDAHLDQLVSQGVVAEGSRPFGAFWPERV
ncbi:hypothetical protein [Streptomyces sp. NPDC094468]|uniref:hypothetical protein n=1 Tax=Streptomyces sp. NPDC094468 TaxID=3366066 RepID=UPI0037F1C3E2